MLWTIHYLIYWSSWTFEQNRKEVFWKICNVTLLWWNIFVVNSINNFYYIIDTFSNFKKKFIKFQDPPVPHPLPRLLHCHLLHHRGMAEVAVNCLMKIPIWRFKWIVTIPFPLPLWIAAFRTTNEPVKVRQTKQNYTLTS